MNLRRGARSQGFRGSCGACERRRAGAAPGKGCRVGAGVGGYLFILVGTLDVVPAAAGARLHGAARKGPGRPELSAVAPTLVARAPEQAWASAVVMATPASAEHTRTCRKHLAADVTSDRTFLLGGDPPPPAPPHPAQLFIVAPPLPPPTPQPFAYPPLIRLLGPAGSAGGALLRQVSLDLCLFFVFAPRD